MRKFNGKQFNFTHIRKVILVQYKFCVLYKLFYVITTSPFYIRIILTLNPYQFEQ